MKGDCDLRGTRTGSPTAKARDMTAKPAVNSE